MQIVMYADHGGELDRRPCTEDNLKEVFKKMIDESELSAGDEFVIEA